MPFERYVYQSTRGAMSVRIHDGGFASLSAAAQRWLNCQRVSLWFCSDSNTLGIGRADNGEGWKLSGGTSKGNFSMMSFLRYHNLDLCGCKLMLSPEHRTLDDGSSIELLVAKIEKRS